MKKMPLILDMDPGIDDAVALAIALTDPEFEVKLVTAVAGNVSVDKTTLNALKLVEFFNRLDVPVARGAAKPLQKEFVDASYIHGASGMPGYEFPAVTHQADSRDAVSAIYQTLLNASEPLTIVATGAYTNIAQLLLDHPEIKSKIKQLVLMGGSLSGGNVSSVAEFNVFTDPDAAKIVYESGLPIVMIGLDVTLKALVNSETLEQLAKLGEPGKMLHGLITYYKDEYAGGKPLHDVNTIFYLVHPEAIKTKKYPVYVCTQGPAQGATIADTQNRWSNGKTNALVGLDIDAAAFNQWLIEKVKQMAAK
ncbi:MAG: ribonucleoside hydrolase RihC [Liquorilactobacillus nagelii]|jgi:non-specific riboncleoside hydrolase|uniref:ribonucleoside hydrolase RihC n=1 Tax=Liquorilactobacillus nagelii TaxID=82688 RepID=UPI0006EEC883|nr:ribonucleoside hydrolase RihC [Liquorilactobacillus nagelii]KRL41750.1 ribonucleoside hydrolase RihC [Liquorilactobacillus nagelii DSM 13675]MCI1634001.1 ribonucleoside hydrolase RihC [Liquorilactobacillus nagelii]MCI1699789.1 ribonucleoside hydrolase RihC [Liquorilactobacillus nagelii]MCI1922537.1 ribonucleoside hydrolase RihC [Liquorilactobacillus nagelii]MCI1976490.1 ribonucleoside hydrolase RihC [Liquorilactobacillus nagelii]